jgi:AcrR family transcriptional regulator
MPRIRAETIAQHKALTRRQILDAAQELIAEVGSAEISLGEIASAVGIGRTTLYEYFTDRDDVIASLVEDQFPEVVEQYLAGIPADLTPPEQLVEVAERTVQFVAADPVLGLILHREVGRLRPAVQQRIRAAHADLISEVATIYAAGVDQRMFHPIPVDLAGRFIQDTVMSAARAVIAAPEPETRLPEILAAMRTFLLHGLTAE